MADEPVTKLRGVIVTLAAMSTQFIAVTLRFRGDDDTPATVTMPVRAAIGQRLQLGDVITIDVSRSV